MIRRYTAATALAGGLIAAAITPATADTPAETTSPSVATATTAGESTPSNDSSAYPANGGSASTEPDETSPGQAFSSEIKPGDVTSVFGNVVNLLSAIFGFIGKVV